MLNRILGITTKLTLASFLLCTQMQAQADWTNPTCFPPCNTCECLDGFWGDVDYLYWKIQNSPEPVPLVIQGPTLTIPGPVLSGPGTSVVLGSQKIDTGWRSGGRVTLGYWFDCNHCYGTEVSYFFLPNKTKKHTVSSNGSPSSSLLLVPFFNVLTEAEDSTAIASPLLGFAGTGTLKLVNEMQGAELNVLTTIPSDFCGSRLIGLAGFRYWNFDEQLTFTTNSPYNPPHFADTYTTKDKFSTQNNFYGGQLGLVWDYNCGCLSVTAKGKIALGAIYERLIINGHLLTGDYNPFGTVTEYPGGYFALPTNIGKYSQIKFAAIPEYNLDIKYQLFDRMQLKLGYTIMYVSNLLWAGKQIDRNINPSQATTYTNALPPMLEGLASPQANLKTQTLWVQGLNVGVEFNF